MPGIPTHGAAGGINFSGKPPVGNQEHGKPAPDHGAAGGYSIPHPWRGNPEPSPGSTGLTNTDPEMGSGKKKGPSHKLPG